MGKRRSERAEPSVLDRARDELFSHIRHCGVLQATEEQQEAWLKDTIGYMAERYPELSPEQLAHLETLGRRYCKPVIPHGA